MYWNRFTWGGSVAIRGHLALSSELRNRWLKAVASDTAIYGVVKNAGFRAAFVPSLMIVNRESCNLPEFYEWMRRQLLVGKLQHGAWPIVFWHGAITSAALCLAAALGIIGLARADITTALASLTGLLSYALAMGGLLVVLEAAVRKAIAGRARTQWLSLGACLRLLCALPITQLLYTAALATVGSMRDVNWRGVRYRIEGPWQVTLVKYQPFQDKSSAPNSTVSL
jgi:hypothetical protein